MQKYYSNRQLAALILPLFVEQTLSLLVGMADTMMVSRLGDAAVSGVSLVDQLCMVIIVLFNAMATGGAVVASQLLGARREEDACCVSNQLILIVAAMGLLILLPILLLRNQLFPLLVGHTEADVFQNAMTYLKITALSYPFIAVYSAGTALFRSMNKSRTTMRVSMLVNVINIGGNALCIFVLHMGVAGVAIPTLISRAIGAMLMVRLLCNEKQTIHIIRGQWKPDGAMIREMLTIGIPNGVENSLFQFGRLLVLRVFTAFGTVQITANAVANTMGVFGILGGQTINLAIITVVGKCVGANDYPQARYYTKKLLAIAYAMTWAIVAVLTLTYRWTIPLFGVSAEAAQLAMQMLIVHHVGAMLLWPIAFTLPNALRAASDVKFSMVVSLASMMCFRVAFSFILGIGFGVGGLGVWISMVIDWVCRSICFVWRYRSGVWETKARIHA